MNAGGDPALTSAGRATAILALGTAASLAAGIVVAKSLALLTGPQGVGLYGLLQSLVGLGAIVFGLGVGTGIVRAVARALADGDEAQNLHIRDAALVLAGLGGLAGALVLVVLQGPIAAAFLGDPGLGWAVVITAPALVLQLVAAVELGDLNGRRRIRAMAVATAASSLAGGACIVAVVAARGVEGLPLGLLLSAAATLLITAVARRRAFDATGSAGSRPGRLHVPSRDAVRWLLAFGGSYSLSQLVGTGVQLLIPVIVLTLLDSEAVGYVRAASVVAVGYLSVLLTAMARDYYPRAAAADPEALPRLMADQARLILAGAAPLILAIAALAPTAVAVLYSDAFSPAVQVLRWMLVGDILKLLSWTGAFVILARAGPGRYFAIEAVSGLCQVVATVLAVRAFGVVGAGVAYAATYALYLVVVRVAVRPIAQMPVTRPVVAGVALALGLATLQIAGDGLPSQVTTTALLLAAAVATAWSIRAFRPAGPWRLSRGRR